MLRGGPSAWVASSKMAFGILHGDHRAVARRSVAGGMTAVVNILTSRLKTKRPTEPLSCSVWPQAIAI